MERTINAKTLRRELRNVLERARRGERFTVLYRSLPVCRIVPLEGAATALTPGREDALYGAPPVVGPDAVAEPIADHDEVLYGWSRKGAH